MKKTLKQILSVFLLVILALVFAGCKKTENVKIGILQPVEHDALGLARKGFIDALAEKGYKEGENLTIDYQNANGQENDLVTLAKSLTNKCDMTLGIGTGATVALQSAQVNSGSTKPIIFTAVTDAVTAGLVTSNAAPGGYITGSSDANPVEAQIDLIKECIPDADKVGILYTQSETNSEVQANQAQAQAEKVGLTIVRMTCTDTTDLAQVAERLCATEGLDALYIPTDNLIAANMTTVKAAVEKYHILCVTGEEGIMAAGGHVTLSIDYYELGKKAGYMAASILKGEAKPESTPVQTMSISECKYVMCSENLTAAGITIPDTVKEKCTDVKAK
ncbi:MAG: ABC transporter substrate-binding protein [Bacilli bacterium]|nr:ABC transporter substrate-binding protein [Bacilli bacterium]